MPLAYWCVLIGGVMPYFWSAVTRSQPGFDNSNPRASYAAMPPHVQRALGAHQNSLEAFPFFAVAVIVAATLGSPLPLLNGLAALWVGLRLVYGFLYLKDMPTARSIVFMLGLIVTLAILTLPVWGYLVTT